MMSNEIESPRELNAAWEGLEQLLASSQSPGLGILLHQRFLEACLRFDGRIWAAYGFPAGMRLLARATQPHLNALPTSQLEAVALVLAQVKERPVPPLPGAAEWEGSLSRVGDITAGILRERTNGTRGEGATQGHSAGVAGIAVPVVVEVKPSRHVHPLYAGLEYAFLSHLEVGVELIGGALKDMVQVIDGSVAAETRAGFAEAIARVDHFSAWGAPATHRCLLRVRFTPLGAQLRGRSATLGFMLAAAAARSSHGIGATYRQIAPGTAATGDIAGTRVVAIEPSTLRHKVSAVIDGGMRRILVPSEQAAIARDHAALHPPSAGRETLEVIGVEDVRDLWHAPSGVLTRRRRSPRSLTNHWVDRIARSRARVILGVLTLLLFATLLVIFVIIRNAPPVSADWEGDTLVLKNENGFATRRLNLAFAPEAVHGPRQNMDFLRFVTDLDGDGKNDVIAIHSSSPFGRDLLSAVNGKGRTLWMRRAEHVVPYRSWMPTDMRFWIVAVGRGQEGPPALLALTRSRQGSLSIITHLDPKTGHTLGALGNLGHLEWYDELTLKGSGRRVFAFAGTQNPLNRGMLAFIDSEALVSPTSSTDSLEIRLLSEPTSLGAGVAGAWSFTADRFTVPTRPSVQNANVEPDGMIRVSVFLFDGIGTIIYEFVGEDLTAPTLLRAYFCDATKDMLRKKFGTIPEEIFRQDALRLAREVRVLTPNGWRAPRFGGDILPEDPQKAHRSSGEAGS